MQELHESYQTANHCYTLTRNEAWPRQESIMIFKTTFQTRHASTLCDYHTPQNRLWNIVCHYFIVAVMVDLTQLSYARID